MKLGREWGQFAYFTDDRTKARRKFCSSSHSLRVAEQEWSLWPPWTPAGEISGVASPAPCGCSKGQAGGQEFGCGHQVACLEPEKSVGEKEETKGNREAWGRDNKPSSVHSLGCRLAGRRWVAAPWLLSSRGWGASLKTDSLLSRGLMPVTLLPAKGQGRYFFRHIQTVSFFILFHRAALFGAFEVEVFFSSPPEGVWVGLFFGYWIERDRRKESD